MENTKIEWSHHTFNPWWGCAKVSQACKHCYAETMAMRMGNNVGINRKGLPLWGVNADRRFFGEEKWAEPLKWDRAAKRAGQRHRVFCASMADIFEDRRDLDVWREKLWGVIEQTPNLDWLLLTKRPQCVKQMVPWGSDWPVNVWLGSTTEDRKCFDERKAHLLENAAKVRFLSVEPLIEDLGIIDLAGIDWVIVGGESGHGSRSMNLEWARSVRDQCRGQGVKFFFKQWGAHNDAGEKVTKKEAGRILDGVTWDEFPIARSLAVNDSRANLEVLNISTAPAEETVDMWSMWTLMAA